MVKLDFRLVVVLWMAAGLILGSAARAEEEKELGWASVAELGLTSVSGNAESTNLSLGASATRTWEEGRFVLEAGAVRVESSTFSRRAVGTTLSDARIVETETSETTAENYFLRGRYERQISERLHWFAGAGWERNEFAGFTDRTSAVAGVGRVWFDDDTSSFTTNLGLTYTQQDDLVEKPDGDDGFLGLRFTWDYLRQLTESTKFTSLLIVDENLDETSDYRADFTNAVAVAMSERLALKVALQLLYDNDPALEAIPLELGDGTPTGLDVLRPLDDLDSILTVNLVINF